LGWELYVPTEMAVSVFDKINEAHASLFEGEQIPCVGLKALGSLRLEKGYRDFGHDLDNTDTIVEAGLSFTCDFEKVGGFVGRESVLAMKARSKLKNGGMPKRMINIFCETDADNVLFHHGEIVRRNGVAVGEIRAGSYGHTLGGCVGLCMAESQDGEPITKKYLEEGKWTVEVGGSGEHRCEARLQPFYDPLNKRINI